MLTEIAFALQLSSTDVSGASIRLPHHVVVVDGQLRRPQARDTAQGSYTGVNSFGAWVVRLMGRTSRREG